MPGPYDVTDKTVDACTNVVRQRRVEPWKSGTTPTDHIRENLRKVTKPEFLKILVDPEVHRGIVVVQNAET